MRLASPAIIRLVRLEASPKTIYRRDDTTSSQYGTQPTYSALPEDRNIFFGGVQEARQPTEAGENQSLSVVAYTTPSVDFRVNDRVDYGGERIEVETKEGLPDDEDPTIYRYTFGDV